MFSKSFEFFNLNFEKQKNELSLEEEFFGSIDSDMYKELAYKHIHQDELNSINDPSEKFKTSIDIKDKARESFTDDNDYLGNNFISYEKAIELIEKSQIEENKSPFVSKLIKNIEENSSSDYEFKFFSTVGGNHLHKVFGVDGLVKMYDKESGQEITCVSIDLNDDEENLETRKADILFDIDKEILEKIKKGIKGNKDNKEYADSKLEEYSRLVTLSFKDKDSERLSHSA
ncbi:MAG: hypothetical protein PF488_02845 [Patescibacteria group bacterium]|jgi:hypothetical protein|nr:hypothetical protein [Patescibacteria group bacterium]